MTPERKAEVEALLDDILGPEPQPVPALATPQPPKPRVVVEAGAVVRDADVVVSRSDVNAKRRGGDTAVSVRRGMPIESPLPPIKPGEVRVNMAAAEQQWWINERDRKAEHAKRRMLDPCNLGIWGPRDE